MTVYELPVHVFALCCWFLRRVGPRLKSWAPAPNRIWLAVCKKPFCVDCNFLLPTAERSPHRSFLSGQRLASFINATCSVFHWTCCDECEERLGHVRFAARSFTCSICLLRRTSHHAGGRYHWRCGGRCWNRRSRWRRGRGGGLRDRKSHPERAGSPRRLLICAVSAAT
jgi:hypothetical protein